MGKRCLYIERRQIGIFPDDLVDRVTGIFEPLDCRCWDSRSSDHGGVVADIPILVDFPDGAVRSPRQIGNVPLRIRKNHGECNAGHDILVPEDLARLSGFWIMENHGFPQNVKREFDPSVVGKLAEFSADPPQILERHIVLQP
jgi:hypothetical protein